MIFISYARKDQTVESLRRVDAQLAQLGTTYIDDLHGYSAPDRLAAVRDALAAATVFVGIHSPSYLATPWTRVEMSAALLRGIPVFALLDRWRLATDQSPEWPWQAQISDLSQSPARWPSDDSPAYPHHSVPAANPVTPNASKISATLLGYSSGTNLARG
ncbi:TIR domain-containing protein [Catelliglobosispora koreensis]|uniref:TIR domain-containing protein n=1 Tax=Catelliglobosispora koreensis TaxID=129052 RepID=UPI003898E629